jgi:hypothetical protein
MTDQPTPDDESEATGEPDGSPGPASRWLVPLLAIVGIVILVGIALGREPTTFDPTSPEGAVQEYLLAISQERWDDAYVILDPEAFADCDPEDIASAGQQQAFTAVHDGTETAGSNTIVRVTLRFGDQDPLGSGWEQPEQFVLVDRDGSWYINEDPWPYFRWACEQF